MKRDPRRALIIDDFEVRHEKLKVKYAAHECHSAYSYDEAVELLNNNQYDLISFDHDLGENQKTGADIARFMGNEGMKCGVVVIHSQNQVGAKNIESILKSAEVCDTIAFRPFGMPAGMTWG